MPFLYFNIKNQKFVNLVFILLASIIGIFLVKKFYKQSYEGAFFGIVLTGFMFSGTWLFIATVFLTPKFIEELYPASLAIIFLLVFFSIILLYFSEKSRIYEKKELKIKRKFNPWNLFWIFTLLSLIRISTTFIF